MEQAAGAVEMCLLKHLLDEWVRLQRRTVMQGKKVLIVVTSHEPLGNTGRKTGYYLPEVAHPFLALIDRGFSADEIDIVSPQGGRAPMDPNSRDLSDPKNKRFLEEPAFAAKLEHTLRPADIRPADYSAIIFAGGHGTMWDFPQAEELLGIAAAIYEQQNHVVAAVCHGPAALVNLKLSDGRYLVAGKAVAGFSNDEEAAVGLTEVVPFLLESKLIERGALYEKAPLWQPKVVVSERLVTGQNPASAEGVGEAVAALLLEQ
jgi:putative intracellular protease/amidase